MKMPNKLLLSIALCSFGVLVGIPLMLVKTASFHESPRLIQTTQNQPDVASAYGFYANMSPTDFEAAKQALSNTNTPFVKGFHALSPDGKKVIAIGLVFPSEAFTQVARKVASENGGSLTCRKNNELIECMILDNADHEIFLVNLLFRDRDGHTFGALFIGNKKDMAPAKKPGVSNVELLPGQIEASLHKCGNV